VGNVKSEPTRSPITKQEAHTPTKTLVSNLPRAQPKRGKTTRIIYQRPSRQRKTHQAADGRSQAKVKKQNAFAIVGYLPSGTGEGDLTTICGPFQPAINSASRDARNAQVGGSAVRWKEKVAHLGWRGAELSRDRSQVTATLRGCTYSTAGRYMARQARLERLIFVFASLAL
jgi:hypothetical protein